MKERPIIYNSEMVRAILEGRKTQTRRVIKANILPKKAYIKELNDMILSILKKRCPYGTIGDRLWVRETWQNMPDDIGNNLIYRATEGDIAGYDLDNTPIKFKWQSPLYMHRWASRITLEITNIRVERVQNINVVDAISEGIKLNQEIIDFMENSPNEFLGWGIDEYKDDIIGSFTNLWNSINEKRGYGWEKNPWVWVIEFKKIETARFPKAPQNQGGGE